MPNLNLIMRKPQTTQIEGHSTKQLAFNLWKRESHESQGKTKGLFHTMGDKIDRTTKSDG